MTPLLRLLLILLVAAAVSFLIGMTASALAALMPCEGEGLVCGINEAIGAYGVLIWVPLGPVIYGVTLFVARNRTALAGATIMLLAPLLISFGIAMVEAWRYVGFYPYKDLRTFLVMFVPPCVTVLAQALVLRSQLAATGHGAP
jgi:hypothetical protein